VKKDLAHAEQEVLNARIKAERSILKDIEEQYEKALTEINLHVAQLLGRQDANLPHVIHQVEYQRMLKQQVQASLDKLHSTEYESVTEYLNDSYTDAFVGTVYTLHHQDMPVILPINQALAVKAITLDTRLKKTMYEEMGKDINQLKKVIQQEITRGISSGMMYSDIAKNISNQAGIPMRRAKTIARTEGGRVQEQASYDAALQAKEKGAKLVKQWNAIRDGKTRDAHRALHNQTRELDEPFEIDGEEAMHPHDFGQAHLDCNCRCTMLTIAKAALDDDILKQMEADADFHNLRIKDTEKYGKAQVQNLGDFKQKYLKAADTTEQTFFAPAKTIAEAEEFARQHGVKYADYSGLPLATANELNQALATLPDDAKPVFVGASATLEQYWGGKLPRSSKQYYGVTVDTYNGIHLGLGKGYDFDTNGYMVGISSSYKTSDKITTAKKTAQERYEKQYGRKWFFNETGETTAMHEMGHVYANIRGIPDGFENDALRWAKESGCDMLKNPSEAWAEAWAAYHTKSNELPDYISKYIAAASGQKASAKTRKALIFFDDDGIISRKKAEFKQAFEAGKIRTIISHQKQARHKKDTKQFVEYSVKLAVRGDYPSYIREDLNNNDLKRLVVSKLKGDVQVTGRGYREFVTCDEVIGYYYSKSQGKYVATKCAQISYAIGDGNIHIIPVKELPEGGGVREPQD